MNYYCKDDENKIDEGEILKELRRQPENEPTYVCKKHLNFEEGVYNPNQAFKDLIKVELLKKALKTEPRITE